MELRPQPVEVRGRFCFYARRNVASAVPTDYRSLLPNTLNENWRDSQGGGVKSRRAAMIEKLLDPDRVEMAGLAFGAAFVLIGLFAVLMP